MDYKIQQPCEISENGVTIGEDTKIWVYTKILPRVLIGKRCIIGSYVEIGPDVTIGDGCKVQNNVSLYKGVTLEEGVFCGPSCVFTNILNPRAFIEKKDQFGQTLVRTGASIGANATILCGRPQDPRVIGSYSIIGAGSVVTRNVDDYAVMVGNPARQTGWACVCGELVARTVSHPENARLQCNKCDREYNFLNSRLSLSE